MTNNPLGGMMKKLVFAALALVAPSILLPQRAAAVQDSVTVLRSSHTCNAMSIDYLAPTAVYSDTNTANTFIYVENEDTAVNIFCNELSYVATTGPARGVKLTPGAWKLWTLPANTIIKWYCRSAHASTTTNAMICTGR